MLFMIHSTILILTYSFTNFSTAWGKEPYSMGAYTAIGIGGHQAHIEKLAEPLYQRPNKRTVSENHYIDMAWLGLIKTKISFLSAWVGMNAMEADFQ